MCRRDCGGKILAVVVVALLVIITRLLPKAPVA